MSRIDQDDGCVYLTEGETWAVGITATVKVRITLTGLSDREADDITAEMVQDAIDSGDYSIDEVTDFDVTEKEVDE